MLTVSAQAAARMELLLKRKGPTERSVLRISRGKNRLHLRVSKIRPGDQTFAHGARPVLVLDKKAAVDLALRHLDIRQTSDGPRLTLRGT